MPICPDSVGIMAATLTLYMLLALTRSTQALVIRRDLTLQPVVRQSRPRE
jgi:hypothetical protein